MLLHHIKVTGFLSYLEATEINLGDANLWLIHGRNGVGKSALFDAITFVLYRQHRGKGPGFQHLLHDDADKAEVELVLEIAGERYRIQRTLERTKTGASCSELAYHWREEKWIAIPGTESKNGLAAWVEQHVRMSHETFTSAVLLEQGKADSFLLATAKHRKDRLLEILDLEWYSRLGQSATQHRNHWANEYKRLQHELSQMQAVSQEDVQKQQATIARLAQELQQHKAVYEQKQREEIAAKRATDLQKQLREVENAKKADSDILNQTETILQRAQRFRELELVLPWLQQSCQNHGQIQQEIADIEKLSQQKKALEETLFHLTRTGQQASEQEQKTEQAAQTTRENYTSLRATLRSCQEEQRRWHASLPQKLQHEGGLHSVLEPSSVEKLSAEDATNWRTQMEELQKHQRDGLLLAEKLRDRLDVIERNECPTCGTCLQDDDIRKRLEREVQTWTDQLQAMWQASVYLLYQVQAALAFWQDAYQEAQRVYDAAKQQVKQLRDKYQEKKGKLQTAKDRLQDAQQRKKQAQETCTAALHALPEAWRGHPAREQKAALADLCQEKASLEGSSVQEERLKQAQDRARQSEGAITALQQQLDKIPLAQRRLVDVVESECEKAKQAVEEVEEKHRTADNLAVLLEQQRLHYEEKRQERDHAGREKQLFDRLERAFGRKGLQARIVAEAQELLQTQANTILAHLSGGDWQIELQENNEQTELKILARDLRRKTPTHRDFLHLSGGEKFRVAISLAVAISQSIRGGRPVNSLVIDEGFGALDEDNRALLVEELQRLSQEILSNGRIMIVSHQEDVCEGFPYRYHIYRDEQGLTRAALSSPNNGI